MVRSLALALTLAVGGCATADVEDIGAADRDKAQMSQVERAAGERGVRVYWVNPPRKAEASPGN